MQVTGYQLREAIRRHELQRDTAAKLFKDSLHVFEGEKKAHPATLMDEFTQAELAVAQLQEAQQKYNLQVRVNVQGKQITLASAVRLLGGAGRAAKMWRDSLGEKEERYTYRNLERSKDTEVAKPVLSFDVAMQRANQAAVYAGELRSAIATGNAKEIEIEGLEPKLFE